MCGRSFAHRSVSWRDRSRKPWANSAPTSTSEHRTAGASRPRSPGCDSARTTCPPRPNEGYGAVVYFSADGTAAHVAIGYGATNYEQGTLVSLKPEQLEAPTRWARGVIEDAHGSVAPFDDVPDYAAKGDLGQSLERATVVCKRVPVQDLDDRVFESLLVEAASYLRPIYAAQTQGRHLSHADLLEHESHHASGKRRGRGGQGIRLSPEQRKLVELRAMGLVNAYLTERRYDVRDTSAKHSYDFLASKGRREMKVEVKGMTSDELGPVAMPRNEVDLHRREKGNTALFVVYRIRLVGPEGRQRAEGGVVKAFIGWDIDEWTVEPTQYRVAPP